MSKRLDSADSVFARLMVMALEGRILARMTAPFHVQLRLQDKEVSLRTPHKFFMHGEVVRVFRSDGTLAIGNSVSFEICLCDPGDEPTGPAYIYRRAFAEAEYIEVYLQGKPPRCELAAHELEILSGLAGQPIMTVMQLQEIAAQHQTQNPQNKKWPALTKNWLQRLFGKLTLQ